MVSKSPRSISCSPSVIVWEGDSDLKIFCCWWLTFWPPVVIFSKVKAVDSKLQYKGMPLARRFQLGSLRLLSNFNAIYLFVYRFTQLKLVCTRVYSRKQFFCLIFTDRSSLWLCRNLMFFQFTVCTERSEDDLCNWWWHRKAAVIACLNVIIHVLLVRICYLFIYLVSQLIPGSWKYGSFLVSLEATNKRILHLITFLFVDHF